MPQKPEGPHQCVPEQGVAEMADVRGLVGIDVRVLDEDLSRPRNARGRLAEHLSDEGAARKEKVDVAAPFHASLSHARRESHSRGDFRGDRARRLPQRFREIEGDR